MTGLLESGQLIIPDRATVVLNRAKGGEANPHRLWRASLSGPGAPGFYTHPPRGEESGCSENLLQLTSQSIDRPGGLLQKPSHSLASLKLSPTRCGKAAPQHKSSRFCTECDRSVCAHVAWEGRKEREEGEEEGRRGEERHTQRIRERERLDLLEFTFRALDTLNEGYFCKVFCLFVLFRFCGFLYHWFEDEGVLGKILDSMKSVRCSELWPPNIYMTFWNKCWKSPINVDIKILMWIYTPKRWQCYT